MSVQFFGGSSLDPYREYDPNVVLGPSFLGQIVKHGQESWAGAWYDWSRRKQARNKVEMDAERWDRLVKEFNESDQPLRLDEMLYLAENGSNDEGEIRKLIMQERASEQRGRDLALSSDISNLMAGFVAYAPQGIAEYALSRGMLRPLTSLRAPAWARSQLFRDVATGIGSEYSTEAFRAYLDPVDGVEEAVINGSIGAAFSSSVLMGASALGLGKQRLKSGLSSKVDKLMEAALESERLYSMAHMGEGIDLKTPIIPLDLDQINRVIIPEMADPNGPGSALRSFVNNQRREPESDGNFWVATRQVNSPGGKQFWWDPRSGKIMERPDYGTEWTETGRTAIAADEAAATVNAMAPTARSVDSLHTADAWRWSRSLTQHVQDQFDPRGMGDQARANAIVGMIEQDILLMKEKIAALRETINNEPPGARRNNLTLELRSQLEDLDRAETRFEAWSKTGSIAEHPFQGRNVARWYIDQFARTGKFPLWTLLADPAFSGSASGRFWQLLGQKLIGTNGAALPGEASRGIESVYAGINSLGGAHWNRFHTKFYGAYGNLIGMGRGLTATELFWHTKRQKLGELWNKVKGQEGEAQSVTPSEFELQVRDAWIDRVRQQQENNGAYEPHPNRHINEGVDAFQELTEELGRMVRKAGGFASQQELKKRIDMLRAELDRPTASFAEPDWNRFPENERAIRKKFWDQMRSGFSDDPIEAMNELVRLRAMAADLGQSVGLDVELVTPQQAVYHDISFIDPHDQASGFTWRNGDKGYIVLVNAKTATSSKVDTLLHEVGHQIDNAFWKDDVLTREIERDFMRWEDEHRALGTDPAKWTREDMMRVREGHRGPPELADSHVPASQIGTSSLDKMRQNFADWTPWAKRFWEYRAEQIAFWMKTEQVPLTIIERHYSEVAANYRRIFDDLEEQARPNRPSRAIRNWMEEVYSGRVSPIEQTLRWIPSTDAWSESGMPDFDPENFVHQTGERLELERQYAELSRQLEASKNGRDWEHHIHRSYDIDKVGSTGEDFRTLVEDWLKERNPKITDDEAAEAAMDVYKKILTGSAWDTWSAMEHQITGGWEDTPRHLRAASLDMPAWYSANGRSAANYLRFDYVDVMRDYLRDAYGVAEMTRITGSWDGEDLLREAQALSKAEGRSEADIGRMSNAYVELRDAVLGRDAIIDDPSALTTRVLRAARHLNVAAFMGKVTQMQLIDLATLIHVSGFKNLLNAMSLDWTKAAKEWGMSVSDEMRDIYGLATEASMMQRASALSETQFGHRTYKTKGERFLADTSKNVFGYSGSHWFTDMARRTAGVLITHEILKLAEKVGTGVRLATQDIHKLKRFGLDAETLGAIYKEWTRNVAEDQRFYRGGILPNTRLYLGGTPLWKDMALRDRLVTAVRQDMDNVVLTPNAGTRPTLLRREHWRALLLYKSFSIHAGQTFNLRMFENGARDIDMMAAVASMIGMTYFVTSARQPDYVERDVEDALVEAVVKSGVVGLPGLMFEVGSQASGTMLGLEAVGVKPKPWASTPDPIGALSPISSQWWSTMQAMYSPLADGDATARALRYMVPYNNLWQWDGLLVNPIRKKAGDAINWVAGN